MITQLSLQLSDLVRQLLMSGNSFAELDEGPDNKDPDFNRFRRVQDTGGHDCTMFGENQGHGLGEFEVLEVVAICDHLVNPSSQDHNHSVLYLNNGK